MRQFNPETVYKCANLTVHLKVKNGDDLAAKIGERTYLSSCIRWQKLMLLGPAVTLIKQTVIVALYSR